MEEKGEEENGVQRENCRDTVGTPRLGARKQPDTPFHKSRPSSINNVEGSQRGLALRDIDPLANIDYFHLRGGSRCRRTLQSNFHCRTHTDRARDDVGEGPIKRE